MFHVVDTLTSKSGDALAGWYAEVVVIDTTTVVPIYADDGGTPIANVSGVTNRAISNSYGEVDFYVPTGDYSVRYYNGAGEYQRTKRGLSMSGAKGDKGDQGDKGDKGDTGDISGLPFVLASTFKSVGTGNNWQPAIQAACDYAATNGIGAVHLPSGTIESWQPAFPGGSPDWWLGSHLVITGNVDLIGADGGTTITLKGPGGATRTKTDGTSGWHSGWLFYVGTGVTRSVLRNIKVNGATTFTNVLLNGESNLYDKGIQMDEGLTPNLVLVDHRDVELSYFGGEIWYMGGTFANTMIHLERVKLHHSPQSALNTGTLAKMIAIAVECGDSYQPAEVLAKDHLYIGCRFYNGYNISFMFTESFSTGYFYSYPFFTDTVPKWLTFEGTRFENIQDLRFGARSRGRIVTVDCNPLIQGDGKLCDVNLDIEAWVNATTNGNGITLVAPPNTTTQVPNCPVGTYFQSPRNIRIAITLKRTEAAVLANKQFGRAVYVLPGLYTSDTCNVIVQGEVQSQFAAVSGLGTGVAGATLPRIVWDPSENSTANDYTAFPGAGAISVDVVPTGIAIVPAGGPQAVTLTNTHGYTFAKGQRLRIAHAGNLGATGNPLTFAASGAGMILTQNRTLYVGGDYLDLEWNWRQGGWIEVGYVTRQQLRFTGSKTYDAPSIASGASAPPTTVTVTGAAIGDRVTAITLGTDALGLTVTGYVSAANTVTVILANLTGGAVDLPSTTLAVEVTKA